MAEIQALSPTPAAPGEQKAGARVVAIDILRAIVMVLMIFVNDLGSVKDAPQWMRHVTRDVDGMGLADVVYPAFIFIVGMSLYYAVLNRISKGDSKTKLLMHVAERTIALLVMGLFFVNGEVLNKEATGMPKPLWNALICISFILIWNFYSRETDNKRVYVLRITGALTLLVLGIIYRGGEDGTDTFGIHWWGILGGIAWAYFAAALVLIFGGNNIYSILIGWLFFCGLSMAGKAGLLPHGGIMSFIPNPIRGGTFVGLALGGVLTSYIFHHFRSKNENGRIFFWLIAFSLILISLCFYTRPFWGISKLARTPAWLFLCSALTIITFLIVYWLADLRGKASWFKLIRPAGSDTLLCYLVPYLVYAVMRLSGFKWPIFLSLGIIGLIKVFLFALLCVWITKLLNQRGIRLKL